MSLSIIVSVVNFLLSILSVLVITMLVFRTKNGLDTAFKFFLGTALTLAIAGFLSINQYLNIVPVRLEAIIFDLSRFLGMVFFILGNLTLLIIVSKNSE